MVDQSQASQTLDFFDTVFTAIPPTYRQLDRNSQEASQAQKNGKQKKGVSIIELH